MRKHKFPSVVCDGISDASMGGMIWDLIYLFGIFTGVWIFYRLFLKISILKERKNEN